MIDPLYIQIFSYITIFLFGVLIGNFTTTVFYRLPRGIMISGFDEQTTRPPFCSNCGHLLRFYEYLPILSWFSTLGKCNYCHVPITKSYIALEVSLGLIAMILYFLFGQNLEYFFIYFCLAALILLNIFIYLEHNFISPLITLSIIILGMIYRTLIDQEIFPWVMKLSLAFMLSIWVRRSTSRHLPESQKTCRTPPELLDLSMKKRLDPDVFQRKTRDDDLLVHLIMPVSLWCDNYGFLIFGAVLSILYLTKKYQNK